MSYHCKHRKGEGNAGLGYVWKCGSVKTHMTNCAIAQHSVLMLWLVVMQDQYGTAMCSM